MEKVVSKFCRLCLLVFLLNPISILANNLNEDQLHFVVIGHTYSTVDSIILRNNFINKINAENPDYVFILGDANLNDSKVLNDYITKINSKVFFSPGNHEIRANSLTNYINTVGYSDTTIITKKCNFIVLNSITSIQNINKYLKNSFTKINLSKPIIVLTHFRIWDDNLFSEYPYQHDKSYYYSEIDSFYRANIDYIFAGNSSAQYFGKQYCKEHKTNKNVTLWSDNIGNTVCYSIGMKYNQHFTNAFLTGKKLWVNTTVINNKSKIVKTKITKQKILKIKKKKTKVFSLFLDKIKSKSLWFTFFVGVFGTSFIFYKFKK